MRISTGWDKPGAARVSSGAAASAASGSSIAAAINPYLSMAPPAFVPGRYCHAEAGLARRSEAKQAGHDFLQGVIETQGPGGDG